MCETCPIERESHVNNFFFLQSPDSDWQKVDYLMEFGEWLFVNEYPVEDAVDQVNSTFLNLNGAKS